MNCLLRLVGRASPCAPDVVNQDASVPTAAGMVAMHKHLPTLLLRPHRRLRRDGGEARRKATPKLRLPV